MDAYYLDSGNFDDENLICEEKLFIFISYFGNSIFHRIFRGLRPEAGNAGSRGDLSHILLEVLEMQLRSAHVRPPEPSPKA